MNKGRRRLSEVTSWTNQGKGIQRVQCEGGAACTVCVCVRSVSKVKTLSSTYIKGCDQGHRVFVITVSRGSKLQIL